MRFYHRLAAPVEASNGGATDFSVRPRATATTVNAAFFREIKEDDVRLKELLHELADQWELVMPPGRQLPILISLVEALRDQIAMHFALEEAYGYFDDAIEAAPQLSSPAESLRGEHIALYEQIRDLADRADDLRRTPAPDVAFQEISVRIKAFCDQLCEHEQRENELILEAFDRDVGVGD